MADTDKQNRDLLMDAKVNRKLTRLLKYTYLYLLVRFKMRYRQVSIITHRDWDGNISATMILQKIPYARLYYSSQQDLHHMIRHVAFRSAQHTPHDIYILDLNVGEFYVTRVVKAIRDIREGRLIEICWIDHHESPALEQIKRYVNLLVDPAAAHTAALVHQFINNNEYAVQLLQLLNGSQTPFTRYWRPVMRETLRAILNTRLRLTVLHCLANGRRTDFTNRLYDRGCQLPPPVPRVLDKVYMTNRGVFFGILEFQEGMDLYPKVRETFLAHPRLDFLLVQFPDGHFSAYQNKQRTRVDLTSLFKLVGGKGHTYAFHFEPQVRVTDEFYRPVTVDDLIYEIQGAV
jgi:hypothetical protein